MYQLVGK